MPLYEETHRHLGSDEETAKTSDRGGKRARSVLAALVVAVVVGGAAAFVESWPGRVVANQPSYLTAALGRGAIEESVVVSGIVSTNLEIVAPIDELDAVRIHEGQAARCQFTEPDGPELRGKVLLVNRSPRLNGGIVTFDAIIGVDDRSRTLYPGTKSTIRIITGRRQNVWRIPQSALRVRLPSATSSGSRDRVYRLGESGPQPVDIKVGMRDESYVELLDGGLDAKDVVITGLVRVTKTLGQ